MVSRRAGSGSSGLPLFFLRDQLTGGNRRRQSGLEPHSGSRSPSSSRRRSRCWRFRTSGACRQPPPTPRIRSRRSSRRQSTRRRHSTPSSMRRAADQARVDQVGPTARSEQLPEGPQPHGTASLASMPHARSSSQASSSTFSTYSRNVSMLPSLQPAMYGAGSPLVSSPADAQAIVAADSTITSAACRPYSAYPTRNACASSWISVRARVGRLVRCDDDPTR